MIKVVMFDLGETLERNRELLPYAAQSVAAISRLENTNGDALDYCLISDFLLANPFEPNAVAARFSEYLDILEQIGLRDQFVPADHRITLSTHANVMKPDRRVFELALERLRSEASLAQCLFITENADHIAAAKTLGMSCLQFGLAGPDGFESWAEGLMKIALLVNPGSAINAAIALEVLGDAEGFQEIGEVAVNDDVVSAAAQALVALDDSSLGELTGLHVTLPAKIHLDLKRPEPKVDVEVPDDTKDEATAFVRSLQAHGKLGGEPSLLGQPTHEVSTDKAGRKVLKRRGFD